MLKFTSAVTGAIIWYAKDAIVGLEPWDPSFEDETGMIPNDAKSIMFISNGAIIPLLEPIHIALDIYQEV